MESSSLALLPAIDIGTVVIGVVLILMHRRDAAEESEFSIDLASCAVRWA